ncbi:MAG TPA: preprotein translocase subunit SecG [Longimicrobium sp.]|nr:preprotein translocase subunit SecG [Longimicrobium sp.]
MFTFLLVLLILDALILIPVVLLQAGKGGGLAAMGGGAGTDSLFGGRHATTILTKATWWTGGIFLALAFTLSILSSRPTRPTSILRQELQNAPAAPANSSPAVPGVTTPAPATQTAPGTQAPSGATPAAPAPAGQGTAPAAGAQPAPAPAPAPATTPEARPVSDGRTGRLPPREPARFASPSPPGVSPRHAVSTLGAGRQSTAPGASNSRSPRGFRHPSSSPPLAPHPSSVSIRHARTRPNGVPKPFDGPPAPSPDAATPPGCTPN